MRAKVSYLLMPQKYVNLKQKTYVSKYLTVNSMKRLDQMFTYKAFLLIMILLTIVILSIFMNI